MAAQVGKDGQLLLQHGADTAVVDKAVNTALWPAASAGFARAAASHLEFGSADLVNQKGEKVKTPLASACWSTHAEDAQVLVAHGADPAIKDDYGQEALSLATQFTTHLNPGQNPVRTPRSVGTVHQWTGTQEKLLGVLKVLVDAKVNLNICDFEGFTPSSGANPNMASTQGFITPLACCAYNGYPCTAALLLQNRANRYAERKNASSAVWSRSRATRSQTTLPLIPCGWNLDSCDSCYSRVNG
ncbi:ANKHD1 [Symbiodinium sp. KB8]|nr:ANKHD1 [Symbiodinium sp. KB8]